MLDSKTRYMFIIGAYRDNEVDSSHPLIISLNKIKNENAIVNYDNPFTPGAQTY